jgi:hypothetical protein
VILILFLPLTFLGGGGLKYDKKVCFRNKALFKCLIETAAVKNPCRAASVVRKILEAAWTSFSKTSDF